MSGIFNDFYQTGKSYKDFDLLLSILGMDENDSMQDILTIACLMISIVGRVLDENRLDQEHINAYNDVLLRVGNLIADSKMTLPPQEYKRVQCALSFKEEDVITSASDMFDIA